MRSTKKQRKERLSVETYEVRIAEGFRCNANTCNSPTYYVGKDGPTCAWCRKPWEGVKVR